MNSIKKKRCVLSKPLLFILVGLTTLLLSSACTTSPTPSAKFTCPGVGFVAHEWCYIIFQVDTTDDERDEIIADYSQYGLSIIAQDLPNSYACSFDHTKIYCLSLSLLLNNDERLLGAELDWISTSPPTWTWTPGYLILEFYDQMEYDKIVELTTDYAEYELKYISPFIPIRNLYHFSYNPDLITFWDFARILWIDDRIRKINEDVRNYFEILIKPE